MIAAEGTVRNLHPSIGVDPVTNEVKPEFRAPVLAAQAKFRSERKKVEQAAARGNLQNAQLPALSAADFGLGKHIGENTYFAPNGPEKIAEVMKHIMKNGDVVMSLPLSAMYLDMVHPGSTEFAPHLQPGRGDLTSSNRSLEDLKKVRILWKYRAPKIGETHPESIKLTDGGLYAAWLVDDEPAEAAKAFEAYEARCQDLLSGNEHALKGGRARRILNGFKYRFKSYGIGTKEGLSGPRHNGVIASNLLVTGLTLSSALYMLFYGLDYAITIAKMPPKKPKHADQPSPAATGMAQAAAANLSATGV